MELFHLIKIQKNMSDEKNLFSKEAIEKIREVVGDTADGMMCTNLTKVPFFTCPMHVQEVDEDGCLWFFSVKNSQHSHDIKNDSRVQFLLADSGTSSFMTLYGKAEILYNREKIDKLWSSYVKVWFPEGKDDPNLTLIKLTPKDGYYWDTKNNRMIGFLKMAASIVTGVTMDDSSSV